MSRIIAGTAGGQRLQMPSGRATRPTTDRVREALFSSIATWLGTAGEDVTRQLAQIAVLDLYAGSGAVGLEAASRGAHPVHLVENNHPTASVIRGNANSCRLNVTVHSCSVDALLNQPPPAQFDVVWADPPYAVEDHTVDEVLVRLAERGWLQADALLVVERSARSRAPQFPAGAEGWVKTYGDVALHYAQVD